MVASRTTAGTLRIGLSGVLYVETRMLNTLPLLQVLQVDILLHEWIRANEMEDFANVQTF